MDATYIPLKRKTVAKEAIHIAVGIRPDGSKEVLSYAIAPTESITIWEEILIDLQERESITIWGRDFNRPPGTWREKRPPFHHGWLKGDGRGRAAVLPQSPFSTLLCARFVISVTKCVSMIVRKSVMILKWCIKRHLKGGIGSTWCFCGKMENQLSKNGGIDPFERLPAHFL